MAKESISSLGQRAGRLYIGASPIPDVVFTGYSAASGFNDGELASSFRALKLVRGTRKQVPLDNGKVQETFTVFGSTNSEDIQKSYERLEALFAIAARDKDISYSQSAIRLYDRARGETYIRSARVYSGSIERADNEIIDSTINMNKAEFIVTLTRDALWEQLTNVKMARESAKNLSAHGGSRKIYSYQHGPAPGLIDMSIIRSDKGNLNRIWYGIKSRRGRELEGFDPTITVNTETWSAVSPRFAEYVTKASDSSETGFIGDVGLQVTFNGPNGRNDDWRWMMRFRMPEWNSYAEDEDNRYNYEGKYKVLVRYKTARDTNMVYGIEVGFGWDDVRTVSGLGEQYLPGTGGDFQYADMGEVTIAGPVSTFLTGRAYMEEFSIWVATGIFGDSQDDYYDKLYLDDIILLPIDKMMYIETPRTLTAGERIEVYQDSQGKGTGYIVFERDEGSPIFPFDLDVVTKSLITSTVDNVELRDWTWPTNSGNIIVHVGDKAAGTGSKYRSGTSSLYCRIIPRGMGVIRNQVAHTVG